MILSHSDPLADLKYGVAGYAVETAEFADCRIVIDRNAAEGIA